MFIRKSDMPKAKRNPIISDYAARRIGESEQPIALLTDIWVLHLMPYAQEQWGDVLTKNEWECVRSAAEIARFDTRRDLKMELVSLVSLAFEYADGSVGGVDEKTLLGKIKKMNPLQCTYVLFVIAHAEAEHVERGEWWQIESRTSRTTADVVTKTRLHGAQAAT
jgi:hypothetical protein